MITLATWASATSELTVHFERPVTLSATNDPSLWTIRVGAFRGRGALLSQIGTRLVLVRFISQFNARANLTVGLAAGANGITSRNGIDLAPFASFPVS